MPWRESHECRPLPSWAPSTRPAVRLFAEPLAGLSRRFPHAEPFAGTTFHARLPASALCRTWGVRWAASSSDDSRLHEGGTRGSPGRCRPRRLRDALLRVEGDTACFGGAESTRSWEEQNTVQSWVRALCLLCVRVGQTVCAGSVWVIVMLPCEQALVSQTRAIHCEHRHTVLWQAGSPDPTGRPRPLGPGWSRLAPCGPPQHPVSGPPFGAQISPPEAESQRVKPHCRASPFGTPKSVPECGPKTGPANGAPKSPTPRCLLRGVRGLCVLVVSATLSLVCSQT